MHSLTTPPQSKVRAGNTSQAPESSDSWAKGTMMVLMIRLLPLIKLCGSSLDNNITDMMPDMNTGVLEVVKRETGQDFESLVDMLAACGRELADDNKEEARANSIGVGHVWELPTLS